LENFIICVNVIYYMISKPIKKLFISTMIHIFFKYIKLRKLYYIIISKINGTKEKKTMVIYQSVFHNYLPMFVSENSISLI